MYPCGEVYMAYASSGNPLICGVKVLHKIIFGTLSMYMDMKTMMKLVNQKKLKIFN